MAETEQGGPIMTRVVVTVHHAEDITPEQVRKAVDRMLDIGFGDANDTLDEVDPGDGAYEDAAIVTHLLFDDPYVLEDQASKPKE